MEADPLVQLVSRALRREITELVSERLPTGPLVEVDRIRWRGPDGQGRLLFSRFHEAATTEVQLLPFLSRKRLPVPRVVARGIPPVRAAERRPWLLTEEPLGVALSERPDAAARARAAELVREIQAGTMKDEPALTALGVPALPASRIRDDAMAAVDLLDRHDAARLRDLADGLHAASLESLGIALVHGDYGLHRVRAHDVASVVTDWLRAHLGCPLQDFVALGVEPPMGAELVDRGIVLHHLFAIRWYAWQAQAGIRAKYECAQRVRALLSAAVPI